MFNEYGGSFPNFLMPIGNDKIQKQRVNKVTNRLKDYYTEIKQKENKEKDTTNKKDNKNNKSKEKIISEFKIVKSNSKINFSDKDTPHIKPFTATTTIKEIRNEIPRPEVKKKLSNDPLISRLHKQNKDFKIEGEVKFKRGSTFLDKNLVTINVLRDLNKGSYSLKTPRPKNKVLSIKGVCKVEVDLSEPNKDKDNNKSNTSKHMNKVIQLNLVG